MALLLSAYGELVSVRQTEDDHLNQETLQNLRLVGGFSGNCRSLGDDRKHERDGS